MRRRAVIGFQSAKPGIGMPNVCKIRRTLSSSTPAVPTTAATRVSLLFANDPMMSARLVKMISEIIGSGSASDSTT